ncbi:MAG: tetratricopeptide repeat protein [Chloroflexota bacterium]|nr:tetratricopeptide repeat protein [Chloroflexota bacterium]
MLDQTVTFTIPGMEALFPPEFNFSTLQGYLAQQINLQIQLGQDQTSVNSHNRWNGLNLVDLPLTALLDSTHPSSGSQNSAELGLLLSVLHNHSLLPRGSAQSKTPPEDLAFPLPDQLIACHQVALALWKAGDYGQAEKLYATLLKARPDLAVGLLYCNFGASALDLLDENNDPEQSAFVIAVNLQPSLWKNYLNLSWDYYLEGNYQEVIHHITRLLELQPSNTLSGIFYTPEDRALLYKLRALAFLQLKKYLAAAQDATAALRFAPSDALTYEIRGHAGLLMGQWMRAKADFDSAIWMGADSSDSAFFSRGLVQLQLGSLANAGQDFGKAFQLNPQYQLAAGFMEQWCNYCLDYKTRGRRLTVGAGKARLDDTSNLRATPSPHWSLQGNSAVANQGTATLPSVRTHVALTTSSRSIMADRLQRIANPPVNLPNYWSILSETVLEFLRNDFPMALASLNRLEKFYGASERPGIAGWSYYYWLSLINLASGQRHRAANYLDRAVALGLPLVLLLDGM